MTGSGTAAVEAMITSLIPEDGNVLILENGVYGERMSRIANVYGINHTLLLLMVMVLHLCAWETLQQ